MKKFIALAIFMIGLFIALPSTGSGSTSPPPDQVSFVADLQLTVHSFDVQAIANETFVVTEYLAIKPPAVCTAENITQKNPDFKMFYRLNYRACLYSHRFRSTTKDNVSIDQVKIRDDTSV